MHDARVGKFLSRDPLENKYPWNSPYAFSENQVIAFVELEGLEKYYAAGGELIATVTGEYSDESRLTSLTYEEGVGIINTDGNFAETLQNHVVDAEKYQQKILNGDYVFTKSYGWVDTKHAFSFTSKPSDSDTRQLWDRINNEEGVEGTYKGKAGYFLTYNQSSLRYIKAGATFWIAKGLSQSEKESIAVTVMNTVSPIHEGLQSLGSWVSSSGFEVSDMPSNVLGLVSYIKGLNKPQTMKLLGGYSEEVSFKVYKQFPGTFSDYKNASPDPVWFKTQYSTSPPKLPEELYIKPAEFNNNFQIFKF